MTVRGDVASNVSANYPSHTNASKTFFSSKYSLRYSDTARAFASVTVSDNSEKFRFRRLPSVAAIKDSPIPRERYSGSTQTCVTWPTSLRTREHRISPIRLLALRSRATNDDSASNTPHPGKRTMLFRKRSDPLSV